jgi:ATP-dependent DNA helicase RecG
MEPLELSEIIQKGESSTVEFKKRIVKGKKTDAYDIAVEMVALSNSRGGYLIIGVDDKTGELDGLSFREIEETNELLANVASDNIKEPILIVTEQISINGHVLVLVTIKEGKDKPYRDNKGIVWIRSGATSRKVVSNDELRRLLQSSGNLLAEEESVYSTTINNLDEELFYTFFEKKNNGKKIEDINQSLIQILNNLGFAKEESLTLAGLLLFGKNPQRFKPMFTVQCISFVGNEISGTQFRDKEPPFEGNISSIFEKTMNFISRNLRKIQVEKSFNSLGQLEIPKEAIEEIVVNALIHRDYFISSTINVFIFDNRVEIISPGKLPNSLSVENIIAGRSNARNPILFTNARFLLPFIGVGSGIPRAISLYPKIEFINDQESERLIAIIKRP